MVVDVDYTLCPPCRNDVLLMSLVGLEFSASFTYSDANLNENFVLEGIQSTRKFISPYSITSRYINIVFHLIAFTNLVTQTTTSATTTAGSGATTNPVSG